MGKSVTTQSRKCVYMKSLKFKIELDNRIHLVTLTYQNCSFPLFAIRGYKYKFLGIYWYPIDIKGGGVRPNECAEWSLDKFREYATDALFKSLKTDANTQKGIENFKNLTNS